MKLIAWDTSSKAGCLVALEWDGKPVAAGARPYRLVSEWTLNLDAAQHSERLLWSIHQMLEASRWKLEDVDVFGVGIGPGSFTGLRIGITTARTLASTVGKPLVGVSSLAALARPVALHYADQPGRTIVVASTDAAKGELFALYGAAKSVCDCIALADQEFPGIWKRGVEEETIPPAELVKAVRKKLGEGGGGKSAAADEKTRWVAVGEGKDRYADEWKGLPRAQRAECPLPHADYVQGRYLGMLCWEAVQAGLARAALDIHPRYLRVADAEKKLKAGLLPPGPTRGKKK